MLWQLVAGWLTYTKIYINRHTNKLDVGQGLVEYAMLLVMISVVMVTLLAVMGPQIQNIFRNIMVNIQDVEAGNT